MRWWKLRVETEALRGEEFDSTVGVVAGRARATPERVVVGHFWKVVSLA